MPGCRLAAGQDHKARHCGCTHPHVRVVEGKNQHFSNDASVPSSGLDGGDEACSVSQGCLVSDQ